MAYPYSSVVRGKTSLLGVELLDDWWIFFFDGWFQDIPKLSTSKRPQIRVVHPSLILAIQLAEPHFSGQLYII